MIKIAYILGKVHSGGKKNLVLEYLRHIDSNNIRIDFICDSDSNSIPEDEVINHGGKVFKIAPYQNIVKNMKDIFHIFNTEKYDIVHAWNSTMNFFPMYLAKKSGIKVRISESLSMANKHEFKTVIKYILKPLSHCYANYFISCGVDCGIFQFGKKTYESGKISIFKTVIDAKNNLYDPVLRESTRKKFGWENNIVYGFIGRYVPQKNPLFIIDIFNEILKRQKCAKLVLIGFGELEEAIEKRIHKYKISESVENLGRREDIQQFYNAFDGFILPSLYEGLPVVGLESQCCGLPIFFSTEITHEAAACNLAIYTSLKESPHIWAEKIITMVQQNIPIRQSHCQDIINAGFDSHSESVRLQNYYLQTINEQYKPINTL